MGSSAFGPNIPDRVGRYEIVLPIARGGMATVYLARSAGHGGFDRYVALKLTAEHLRDDPEFAQHLVEEAKLVAHLRHTNVVPVLDVGEEWEGQSGAVFLVMEYVPGDSLAGLYRIAKKTNVPVPPRVGLRAVVDALAGLHAAHEHTDEDGKPQSLVHRDFSPQNILVGTDGIARLTDFGIAKASSRASITVAGTMKGKVSYASPEQARGKPLDRRCDVWAGGVVAWEIVTGRKMYPTSERTLLDIVQSPPPRLRDVMPDVSEELDEIIHGALAVDVEKRTPTAQMFARLLAQAAKNVDMLAEIDEVAEHVARAVAPILNERKDKIASARRAREMQSQPEISQASAMVETGPQLPPAKAGDEANDVLAAAKTVPLPSLPDIPLVTHRIDSASTVPAAVAEALSGSQRTLRNEEIVGGDAYQASSPSMTPSGVSTPAIPARSSVKPPPPAEIGALVAPTPWRQSLLSFHDLRQSLLDRVTRFIAERPLLVLGGASAMAGLLLIAAVIIFVLSSSSSAPAPPPPVAAKSAPSLAASAAPVTTTPRAPTEDPVAGSPQLVLNANAPIAKVRIGKRTVDMEVPAPKVNIDLSTEESNADKLTVYATSTDGRFSSATWNSGDVDVTVTFPAAAKTAKPKPPPPKKH